MSLLPVLDVKKPKMKPDSAPEPLPPACFLWGVVAPPRSGKSNLLMTLIGASHMYGRKYFSEIYYFSPSQNFDNTTRFVLPKLDNVIQIDDMDQLENADILVRQIMLSQAKESQEDLANRPKILFCFDDLAGTLEKNKTLQKLCTKYRHYNISIIISVQQFKSIPVMIRNSLTCFTMFNIPSLKEFEKISDEILDRFPNGQELAKYATTKRYEFCYINIEKATMHRCFDELLYDRSTDPAFD